MYVIGLTGGIASGKSIAAGFLEQLGAKVLDADAIGHQVILPGQPAYYEILDSFGRGILGEEGAIHRQKLGAIVFSSPDKLLLLNKITHPRIFSEIREQLEALRQKQPETVVVVEAALLFEIGLDKLVDEVWTVEADREVQVKRLRERNGFSEKQAIERIQSQATDSERIAKAHRVVYNNAGVEELLRQIMEIWGSNP